MKRILTPLRFQAGVQALGFIVTVMFAVMVRPLDADQKRDKEVQRVKSGRKTGELVPSFYVRAVTGPNRNKSICYVCRNGDRPVIMVLMRKTHDDLIPLLKRLDQVVDKNRANGLRCFGVLIHEEPSEATPIVQTMAFNSKIQVPLSVTTDVVSAPACQNLNPDADLTVVMYRDLRVVSTFGFDSVELKKNDVDRVMSGVEKLLKED
ncbi:MAG: hypothetical protein CMJ78_14725 [Planctomycetaceae bacterium]|nr:hypothetical protein [Planctomycetaceae bacterium]